MHSQRTKKANGHCPSRTPQEKKAKWPCLKGKGSKLRNALLLLIFFSSHSEELHVCRDLCKKCYKYFVFDTEAFYKTIRLFVLCRFPTERKKFPDKIQNLLIFIGGSSSIWLKFGRYVIQKIPWGRYSKYYYTASTQDAAYNDQTN